MEKIFLYSPSKVFPAKQVSYFFSVSGAKYPVDAINKMYGRKPHEKKTFYPKIENPLWKGIALKTQKLPGK